MMMSHANFRIALALIGGLGMAGCDGQKEPEPGSPKDRYGAAFEEGLKGCAASAEALGQSWVGKAYGELETHLAANPPAEVATIRVIRPDTAVTKDYRINRLNISLDEKDIVTKTYCG